MPASSPRNRPARAKRARPFRAGTIALVGRPNVGKSTLLNQLLGERIAITSHHPQTTRDRVAGILTTEDTQYVFQDTPGLHAPRNRLGKRMNDVAQGTASASDVIVMVTDVGPTGGAEIRKEDTAASAAIGDAKRVVLVVNKIDRVKEKAKLLEVLAAYATLRDFEAIVPTSARTRDGFSDLLEVLRDLLPEGDALYPPDDISDRPVRFFVGELVREQVLARTREEVPHGVAVTVDAYEEPATSGATTVPKRSLTRITLTIHVAKESHKGIIIGKGGKMLEAIGSAARERAEALIGRRIHLDVKVRATPGWFDDAGRLAELGYAADEIEKKPKRKARG